MNKIHYDAFAGVIDTVGIEDIIFDLIKYEIEKIPVEATIIDLTSETGTIFGDSMKFKAENYPEIEEIKNRLKGKFEDEYEENERIRLTIDRFEMVIWCRGLGPGVCSHPFSSGELETNEFKANHIEFVSQFFLIMGVAKYFEGKNGKGKKTTIGDLKKDYNRLHKLLAHEAVHIIQRIYNVGRGALFFEPRMREEEKEILTTHTFYINKPSEIEAYARSVIEELKEMDLNTLEEMREALPRCWSYEFVKEHISKRNFKTFINKIYFLMKEYLETLKVV